MWFTQHAILLNSHPRTRNGNNDRLRAHLNSVNLCLIKMRTISRAAYGYNTFAAIIVKFSWNLYCAYICKYISSAHNYIEHIFVGMPDEMWSVIWVGATLSRYVRRQCAPDFCVMQIARVTVNFPAGINGNLCSSFWYLRRWPSNDRTH